jgi:Uma2 family endonuclease
LLPESNWQPSPASVIVIGDQVRIPAWVKDLESFRRWARSDEYPEHGWFSFLHGVLWVDLSMEQLFTHNQVKGVFTIVVGGLVRSINLGYSFVDRILLSNPAADLSTEPDAVFTSWDAVKSGRVKLIPGAEEGYVELEGTPDMVLEVISPTSVRKDKEWLRDLYWRAGIPEYWLVDARGTTLEFLILRHTSRGYVATRKQNGWVKSAVFGCAFQLTRQTDPLGNPQYSLLMQP